MLQAVSVLADVKFRPCPFLDALRFLVVQHQSCGEEQGLVRALGGHTSFAELEAGLQPRDFELILTIINPDREGRRLIAACPWLIPRSGEIALDWLTEDQCSAEALHRFFDQHFVQPWHCTQETTHYHATTYTGPSHRPGRNFVAYSDRPSKISPESSCCHIEARYQGIVALRKTGIHTVSDWLSFDHRAFWQKHLRLYEIDLTRLGRWFDNKRTRKRRQRPCWHLSGKYSYNVDRALGSVLFRTSGRHSTEQEINVQRFVDCFGRGPFLRSIDPTQFLPDVETLC
jgi:hypothetical protein